MTAEQICYFCRREDGWANDPEIGPLKEELQRLRTQLESMARELSNARIARDTALVELRNLTRVRT
jgi:hypothetical protein